VQTELVYTKTKSERGLSQVWPCFQGSFMKFIPVFTFQPVFEHYSARMFQQYYEEGFQRIELRQTPGTYGTNGRLEITDKLAMLTSVANGFTATHPDFSVGYILCATRFMPPADVAADVLGVYEAAKASPGIVIGYDVVCEEDTLRQNREYTEAFVAV
jgi:hypothetical protein